MSTSINVQVSAPVLPSAAHDSSRPLQLFPALMKDPCPNVYPFGRIPLRPSSIFFATSLSYVSVNLSPILPGHVLVMPRSNIARVSDLPADQLCDLWLTAQHVARVFEKRFHAQALTLAIQDGKEAGQTVECVHIHLIPRQPLDIVNKDDIYGMIEANVPAAAESDNVLPSAHGTLRDSLDDGKRIKRSVEEMATEARQFAGWMREEGVPQFVQVHNLQMQTQ